MIEGNLENLLNPGTPAPVTPVNPDDQPIELSTLQKERIKELLRLPTEQIPSLDVMATDIFKRPCHGRSSEVRAIKKFLSELNKKNGKPGFLNTSPMLELNLPQKEFIQQHANSMNSLEIASTLYGKKCHPNSREVLSVRAYLDSLPDVLVRRNPISEGTPAQAVPLARKIDFNADPDGKVVSEVFAAEEGIDGTRMGGEGYEPPRRIREAAKRVNEYILDGVKMSELDKDKRLEKNLLGLIKYLHSFRFKLLMNESSNEKEKNLLEGNFIRYTWNKPDLTEEEVDLYLNLCVSITDHYRMQAEMATLYDSLQDITSEPDGRKLSMSLVEAINNVRENIEKNQTRQQKLIESLDGKRSEKSDRNASQNASLVHLVDFWKNQEHREQMVMLAELRQKKLKEEKTRLENLDDLKFQLWGAKDEELFGG